jgi:hypothetical protein
MSFMRALRDDRGVALVAALWFTVAVAGMAATFSALARGEAMRSRNLVDAIRARPILEAALEQAVLAIEGTRDTEQLSYLRTQWQFDGADVLIHVTGESGRIDLNRVDSAFVAILVEELGGKKDVAGRIGDAMVDWRDTNDLAQRNGAEVRDYRQAGRNGGPANGPFRHVAELRDLLPMTPDLYVQLSDLFTVATGEARPSELLAPELTRRVLRTAPPPAPDAEGISDDGSEDFDEQLDIEEAAAAGEEDTALGSRSRGRQVFADPKGIYAVRLDIRLVNGYEAHANALIWMQPDGPRPYRLLDWEPSPLRDEPTR